MLNLCPLLRIKFQSAFTVIINLFSPQSEAIHFVTDCPTLFNARQKLLDYIKIEERALTPKELFIAIINAQTDRQYKELIQILNKFPYPFYVPPSLYLYVLLYTV